MTSADKNPALSTFSVRFVVAVFGGALVGLVLGVLLAAVLDGPQNPFAVMPWTIMAAALFLLPMHYYQSTSGDRRQDAAPAEEDPRR